MAVATGVDSVLWLIVITTVVHIAEYIDAARMVRPPAPRTH